MVVGLSGGVDSSVAALLLKQQGEGVGLFMKNWEDDDTGGILLVAAGSGRRDERCRPDWHRRRGEELREGIQGARLRRIPAGNTQAGRTPNPDVLCNAEIVPRLPLIMRWRWRRSPPAITPACEVASPTGVGVEYQLPKAEGRHQRPELLPHCPESGAAVEDDLPLAGVYSATSAASLRLRARTWRRRSDSTGIHVYRRAAVKEFP